MNKLKGIEPERVFYYFSELSKIPHGSGNTKEISDYCVDFAKKHNLKYIQDEKNNVIIFKKAQNSGSDKTVIIQGHLDMVCEKEAELKFDFLKDSLNLEIDRDFVHANGTTLGGDDGIAIAYALAILEDCNMAHPNLEAVFTVDEEIGLIGAQFIDLSSLKGNILLNIDSEQEGVFTVSCAGGTTVGCKLPLSYEEVSGKKYSVKIHGLKGGHSGVEIDKLRANSNVLSARLIYMLLKNCKVNLVNISGGLKDNAITPFTTFEIVTDSNVDKLIDEFYKNIKNEYRISDPDIQIDYISEDISCSAVGEDLTKKAISLLLALPDGVMNMDSEIKGLVRTSLNMGILQTNEDYMLASFAVRSSLKSEKEALIDKVKSVVYLAGGEVSSSGDYPPWEYNPESYLREVISKVYNKLYNKEPHFEAIHAGLECGVIGEKIKNLDAISFGPDMIDIHTPKERLSISSVKRVWEFIKEVLSEM